MKKHLVSTLTAALTVSTLCSGCAVNEMPDTVGYIPEDILLATLGELDKIDCVTASKNNALEITFKDGTKCVKQLERK